MSEGHRLRRRRLLGRWRMLGGEALDGVMARPTRLALTTFGAALGVGSILATIGLAQTASSQVSRRFDAVAATQLSVQPRTASDPTGGQTSLVTLPWDAGQRIGRLAGALAAGTISPLQPQAALRTVAVVDPTSPATTGVPLIAASPGLFDAVLAHVGTGRLFDSGNDGRADAVVVLGSRTASRLGINRVDDAPTVFIGDRAFAVIGIVDSVIRHTELLDAAVVPDGTAKKYFGLAAPASVQIRTAIGAAPSVARQSAIALAPGQAQLLEVSVPSTSTTLRDHVQHDVNVLFLVLGGVALLAGAVGIANVTLLSVMERTGEIGLRRAVGATRRDIAWQFLIESGITGLLGGLVGTAGGVLVTSVVAVNRRWTPVLDLRLAIAAPVVGAAIGVAAGAYPAWRACRLEPIAALRAM